MRSQPFARRGDGASGTASGRTPRAMSSPSGIVIAPVLGYISDGFAPAGHGKGIELPGVAKGIFGPTLKNNLKCLFEECVVLSLVSPVGIDVEVAVYAVVDSTDDTEVHSALADVVKHGDVFGDVDWVAVCDGYAALAEAKCGSVGGEIYAGEDGVGGGGGDPTIPEEMVLRAPDGGKAGLLEESGLGAPLFDPGVALGLAAVNI